MSDLLDHELLIGNSLDNTTWAQELREALHQIRAAYRESHGGADPIAAARQPKQLYIVRHAESVSNKVLRESPAIFKPCQMCRVGFDSDVSPEGEEQLHLVRHYSSMLLPQLEGILVSPLLRAVQTALTLFGEECDTDDDDGFGFREHILARKKQLCWKELLALKEETLDEWTEEYLCCYGRNQKSSMLTDRVEYVLQFFLALPWQCFAVVGHSVWFAVMLDSERRHIGNAEIWRVELEGAMNDDGEIDPIIVSHCKVAGPPHDLIMANELIEVASESN